MKFFRIELVHHHNAEKFLRQVVMHKGDKVYDFGLILV